MTVIQPLLSLVMIVRNEAHGLRATLESFKPFVDRWDILDTGSTDGTPELVREVMRGVPGLLHHGDFVDFSQARNDALELTFQSFLSDRPVFTIMPDADDRLEGGKVLRQFLSCVTQATSTDTEVHEAYNLNLHWPAGGGDYHLPLILRTSSRWRYTGKVHEYVDGGKIPNLVIPGVRVIKHSTPKSAEASKKRWTRDATLLEAELAGDPLSPRTQFYLAQTYECLGRHADAILMYERRIATGGFVDETYEAWFRRAKIKAATGCPWPETMAAYLEAHAFLPTRAEPLYAIAKYYEAKDNFPLFYLFAARAAAVPMPNTMLWVDRDVYEWKAADLAAISAFWLAPKVNEPMVLATGKAYADATLRVRPDDHRVQANRALYAPSAEQLFGASHQEIDWHPEAPYVAMNPSIHWDGSVLRCIVRTTNYKIVDGQYLTPDDNVIFTKNMMLELDVDQPWRPTRATLMIDHDHHARSGFPVHGFEDCRLFSFNESLYATATACDFDDNKGSREIVLLCIEPGDNVVEAYAVRRADPVRGPWSAHHQKNWMPFASQSGRLPKTVYSCDPMRIVEVEDIGASADPHGEYTIAGRMRGGSQLILWRPGEFITKRHLGLVHEVSFNGTGRIYLHRFVEFTELVEGGLRISAMTEPFFFHNRGIEFCAGLARVWSESAGRRLIASYGVNDCQAFVGIFDARKVLERLVPVK